MEPQDVERIINHLAATLAKQDGINDDLRACILEQREFTRQQLACNQDVKTTLARVETLLARMIPQGENGRDA